MKKLSAYPEIIAAIIAVIGGFLFSVILGYLEGRIGFTAVVTVVAALLLSLLLYSLYRLTGPRVTTTAAIVMLMIGFLVFLTLGGRRGDTFSTPTETPPPLVTTPTSPLAGMTSPTPEAEMSTSATVWTPGPTPTTPLGPEVAPVQEQGYALPLSEPFDVVFDGSDLHVLFESRLVKLELVDAEGRFRAVEHMLCPATNSMTWDASRGQYWAVCGGPRWVGEEIDLIDQAGNRTVTFTVPQTFVGSPRFVAWDGEHLWATSSEGPLYKLRPVGDGGELEEIDSYAPGVNRYGLEKASGVAWDGNNLWLLVGDLLSELDGAGQPICGIQLPSVPTWFGWQGLAWDGQFLWVAHMDASKVYRVDPAKCR